MSIVEKAIQKRRQDAQSAAEFRHHEESEDRHDNARPDAPGDATKDSSPASASPGIARHRIAIDWERLRQYGFAPPEEYADRLANEYRQVKRPLLENLNHTDDAKTRRVRHMNRIVVTSAVPGEGKSFTAINLGLSLARERDYNVVLVDGDVLKPRTTAAFGLGGRPGFGDLLADESMPVESAIVETDYSSLWILPAGRRDSLLAEHLSSRRADQILAHLARMRPAQVILLDSPPLLPTAEAPVLAARAGQVVLVVQAGVTPQHALRAALASLKEDHVVNLLLNQAELPKWDDYYSQYSGYYGEKA